MALTRPNEGYKICPHCNGKTVCNCASCGTETTTRARGMGARWMEAGMCKACNGQGQVIDPDYKPPDAKWVTPNLDKTGNVRHHVTHEASDVRSGVFIRFER